MVVKTKRKEVFLNDKRKEILALLSRNGKVSLIKLAKTLGISHVAVRKHIQKLEEKGVLHVRGNINPQALGFRLVLVFMEIINEEYMFRIIEKFRECPRIIFLANMIGGYNLIALMYAENEDVLGCLGSVCSIRTMEGIRRSEVYILSSIIKPKYLPLDFPSKGRRKVAPCGRKCTECIEYKTQKCLGCPATVHYKGFQYF